MPFDLRALKSQAAVGKAACCCIMATVFNQLKGDERRTKSRGWHFWCSGINLTRGRPWLH